MRISEDETSEEVNKEIKTTEQNRVFGFSPRTKRYQEG